MATKTIPIITATKATSPPAVASRRNEWQWWHRIELVDQTPGCHAVAAW